MTQGMGDITAKQFEQLIDITMNHQATLKDIHGISDDAMENIYAQAYQFYKQGRTDEAEKFFKVLCMYDLKNPDYFIGLGAVYQFKKNYAKACDIYALAYVMAENNFLPVFFAGQCHLLMGDITKSIQCFDIISKRCDDEKLLNKAQAYLQLLENSDKAEAEKESA